MQKEDIKVGDFIIFEYFTKERFSGKIISISENKVEVEICISNKKNSKCEYDVIESTFNQIISKM